MDRSSGLGTLLTVTLLSTLLSVLTILLLASDLGASLPYNPLLALRRNMPKAGADAETEQRLDEALKPLRQALVHPEPSVERINALISFNTILGTFAGKTGGYPNSEGKLVPLRAALDIIKSSEYEEHVPTRLIDEMKYVSDGEAYKVLNIGSGDCAVVRIIQPAMIDPKRSAGQFDCLAYGFWTPKGAAF